MLNIRKLYLYFVYFECRPASLFEKWYAYNTWKLAYVSRSTRRLNPGLSGSTRRLGYFKSHIPRIIRHCLGYQACSTVNVLSVGSSERKAHPWLYSAWFGRIFRNTRSMSCFVAIWFTHTYTRKQKTLCVTGHFCPGLKNSFVFIWETCQPIKGLLTCAGLARIRTWGWLVWLGSYCGFKTRVKINFKRKIGLV